MFVFSRMTRRQAQVATAAATSSGPATATTSLDEAVASSSGDFPIDAYDDLRVSEILPLLDELDDAELVVVRRREDSGRARATVLSRIDDLLIVAAEEDAAPADATVSMSAIDDDSPIEDYDDLRVSEILPLLTELDGVELADVRRRESAGRARAMILNRIDELSGGVAAAAKKAPAKKAGAKKAPAKKAVAKKAPATKAAAAKKAPAKKAAAKKAPAKKAAVAKKAPAKKAAAKKATKATKK